MCCFSLILFHVCLFLIFHLGEKDMPGKATVQKHNDFQMSFALGDLYKVIGQRQSLFALALSHLFVRLIEAVGKIT